MTLRTSLTCSTRFSRADLIKCDVVAWIAAYGARSPSADEARELGTPHIRLRTSSCGKFHVRPACSFVRFTKDLVLDQLR